MCAAAIVTNAVGSPPIGSFASQRFALAVVESRFDDADHEIGLARAHVEVVALQEFQEALAAQHAILVGSYITVSDALCVFEHLGGVLADQRTHMASSAFSSSNTLASGSASFDAVSAASLIRFSPAGVKPRSRQ